MTRQQDESPVPNTDGRRKRWKRTLLLTALFVCLFFVAVAERGGPAISKVRKDGIVAARRSGQTIFYSLCSDRATRLLETLHGLFCAAPESSGQADHMEDRP